MARLKCCLIIVLILLLLAGCSSPKNGSAVQPKKDTNILNKRDYNKNLDWNIKISLKQTAEGRKPFIETNVPEETKEDKINLKVLYEEPLAPPTILVGSSSGGFSGSSLNFKKQVNLDGKKFNFGTYNIPLNPGVNIYAIDLMKANVSWQHFYVKRIIENPESVPIKYYEEITGRYNVKDVLKITNPSHGFIVTNNSTPISFKADISAGSFGDNIFKLIINKFTDKKFDKYREIKLPIKNGKINTAFKLPQTGYYAVEVISPKYFPTPQGTSGIAWAEFYIEVH